MRLPTVQPAIYTRPVSVRVLEAPRAATRTLGRLVSDKTQLPAEARPREVTRFTIQVKRGVDAREEVAAALKARGYTPRSVNQAPREFVVYIPHPADTEPHASTALPQ